MIRKLLDMPDPTRIRNFYYIIEENSAQYPVTTRISTENLTLSCSATSLCSSWSIWTLLRVILKLEPWVAKVYQSLLDSREQSFPKFGGKCWYEKCLQWNWKIYSLLRKTEFWRDDFRKKGKKQILITASSWELHTVFQDLRSHEKGPRQFWEFLVERDIGSNKPN